MDSRILARARLWLMSALLAAFPAFAAEPIEVVTTFSILGDITQRVGGDRIKVHTLVGPNADAHVYQPTPADAKAIAQARLVVVNGLGFEGWLERLIKSSGYRGKVATATNGIRTLQRSAHDHHDSHHDNVDPHAWQDLSNALIYVDNIGKALGEIDPSGKTSYQANVEKYRQEIGALDTELRKTFNSIPKSRRKVVTTHDAFGYLARAYGLDFIAPVGINTDAEPSAADIGRIIKQIRRDKIPAVFVESISDSRLLERIRQESGAKIGGTLYSDALSKDDGPVVTYLDMMRHNANTLVEALKE
ncbi:MAG: metal ABC transporter substrate-binding protein [Propionivibrio sp.]|jgi:zinc/manganese transport system substrate-binding protein|nr:metal ABC transporter substrate-binding protein [Propionivibrio sp.]MBP8162843.1 metal ABC transporter substrate-binding protein [Propionivibrio sp.]